MTDKDKDTHSKEAKLEAIQKEIDRLVAERERLKSDAIQQKE